jgi:LacI family transcriptional regulator
MASMPVTIRDVAQRLSLSHTTVSRVLNGRVDINIPEITRQRVMDAAAEMGYRPNSLARALATGHTYVITLSIPLLQSYTEEIARHLGTRVVAHDFEMIISDMARHQGPHPYRFDRAPLAVDGIIGVDLPWREDTLRNLSGDADTPFVSVGTYPLESTDYVVVDLVPGATECVRHLVGVGARRIAYVVWSPMNRPGDARREAYEAVMREAGLRPEYFGVSMPTRMAAWKELPGYLQADRLPDALFCFNDDMAIGAFRALSDLGIRVPDEVLLCGCDGLPDAEFLSVPLTTVVQPIEEMCDVAWQFLRRRMEHRDLPRQQVTLGSRMVVRKSSTR